MTTLYRRLGRLGAGSAAAAALSVVVASVALVFSAPASAQISSCADPVTSAPTGPATVSVATTTSFGKVIVIGSGAYTGCSLYLLTSDQLHALTGSHFACSDDLNAIGAPCDTVLWPALLTDGAPIAGAGVNPKLLGTVTRTDLPGLPAVQQVTYAGQPLYRFVFDENPGETSGANLFDPVTSPTGIWYLVEPRRGLPAPGTAQMQLETAPVGGSGTDETVLAVSMDHGFDLLPDGSFPVYTLRPDHGHGKGHGHGWGPGHGHGCQMLCAQYWPPVLTSGQPAAGPGVDQHALGTLRRPDGSQQVTYKGRPLYLFADDAYFSLSALNLGDPYGFARIDGAGADTIWGVFDTIPSSS
jgi:predicted lipoprotein with Yx(FWY)xxD motif